jgi:DNA-binding CsgD family transcriptional regulator
MKKPATHKKTPAIISDKYEGLSLLEVFQKVPGLIYIRDRATSGIVWCNKTTEDTFGYKEKEIIALGKDLFPLIVHPDDFHLIESSNKHYSYSSVNFGGVIRVKKKNSNEYKWLVGISTIFRRDDTGEPLQTLCVFLDFTSIQHTHPQLNEALKEALSIQYKNIRDILTDREKEIIKLIVLGYKNKDIAGKLYLSKYTIEGYRKNIRLKLNVSNTSQLVALAKQTGLG